MSEPKEAKVARYVCSSCGRTDVIVNAAHPSVDDRYAIGFCHSCTPEPVYDPVKKRTKPINRASVALIRADLWDPATLARRKERERARKLIRDLTAGKLRDGTPELIEARGLLVQYEQDAAARRP